jgi:hypothetical protein
MSLATKFSTWDGIGLPTQQGGCGVFHFRVVASSLVPYAYWFLLCSKGCWWDHAGLFHFGVTMKGVTS